MCSILLSTLNSSEGKHGEVVTLLGITNKLVDCIRHGLDKLLRRTIKSIDNLVDTLSAKQLTFGILGLGQSIGIKE